MPNTSSRNSKGVNTLLHTLRGEQFRHLQNLNHSTARLSASSSHTIPALPIRLASTEIYSSDPAPATSTSRDAVRPPWSGPAPPKSWRPIRATDSHDTPQWRAEALRIAFSLIVDGDRNIPGIQQPSPIPPLSLLCLQLILAKYTSPHNSQFREEVVPYIPDHLRRGLVRHCAVHAPLPSWKLEALYEPDGHADGEILVVGPSANLKDDHFTLMSSVQQLTVAQSLPVSDDGGHPVRAQDWSWEEDDHSYQALHSVILLSTFLSTSTFLSLPATLTYLALIDLSTPLPLHRLPKICPLLVILDLSFNLWLVEPESEGLKSIERIDWTRWNDLNRVGLRGCFVSDELLQRINKGRWDDIEVIQ
ncbi:hypothetical protein CPB83DRAFT_887989 [Crepidotus variabilis]|uniref:Uncharacterized protein n=1 Tax=Crepidotus variabilis TaxID=179855 RepID=A0A9P6EUU6_9AGAR|nr:hypothetical protein CPB83DRAFT_887989 [Crepidotus variabilis]